MSEQPTEIEKPWCVYSHGAGPSGFGKIVRDNKTAVHILYSESQKHTPEYWDPRFVKRFDTLDDAVEHYIKNWKIIDKGITDDKVREQAKKYFPSYYKDKKDN